MKQFSCIYHPTTVICIDDDVQFAQTLSIILEHAGIFHRTFNQHQTAIPFINSDRYREDLLNRLITSDDDENLHYESDVFAHEIMQANRHQQISTLVIDYDMPGINGLQVCAQIQNPAVKKILLTGAADENLAINAFNQGLIYQYVRKQDPNFINHLQRAILQAQQDYFQALSALPLKILAGRPDATALIEPAFKTYFDHICKEYNIVEYYLVEGMGSFITIDTHKRLYSLITLNDDLIDMYLHSQSSETLSDQHIQSINQRLLVPCYYDPFHQPNIETPHLASYLRPPTLINGLSCTYYYVFDLNLIQVQNHFND